MTATRHWTIWCDYVGPHPSDYDHWEIADDERCWEWTDHGLSRVGEARKSASGEGWTHKGGKDLCPRHSA